MELNQAQLTQIISQAVAGGIAASGSKSYGWKAPATTITTNLIHGPGGIFGVCGLDNQVISARIHPRGIAAHLRVFGSNNTNPLFPFITGIEEDAGTEPSTECATCLSGEIEGCIQTAQFGRVCRETKTYAPNDVINRINSGEVDLVLMNDILNFQEDAMSPMADFDRNTLLQIATAVGMMTVGVLMQQVLTRWWFQGNPANNVGTGYAEPPGLGMLVSTGKVDALTGTTCPALDSDVKQFNYNWVNSVDAAGNFRIVRFIIAMENYLFHNADRMGLRPVTWAFVMRPELWTELTEIWPYAYLTTRNIVLPAGNINNFDATRMNEMRDDMRTGLFLFVNGRRHQVITDDGIFESNNNNDGNLLVNEFASDIFMIPLTYLGNRAATFIQHKDYRAAAPDLNLARLNDEIWTDNGRFLWTNERLKWCYTVSGKVEPRILLKVPQLAGRINDVKYSPLQHTRDWDQDSDYFYKGGEASRTPGTLYSEWNLPQ